MTEWSFYLTIPHQFVQGELVDYYGPTNTTQDKYQFKPYLENRYERILAGCFHVEVRYGQKRAHHGGRTSWEYPKSPDVTTGTIVLLPLIDRVAPEEALGEILQEEVGFSLASPEPDWAKGIRMPGVPELTREVEEARAIIAREAERVERLTAEIADIHSFRRLLFGTGTELEAIVK